MGFIKKYRIEIITLALFTVIYFFIRFTNILTLPIFTDEAIYVRWAQIAKQDANWRFISLTDGKQPMFVWMTILLMRIVKDPLLAGRSISVFSGFFTMIGLYFLGNELFKNRKLGLICSFLYLIFPFALVYDRMALYDSLVGAFAVWGFYLEVLLARRLRLDIALIASFVIGGGMLTKTNAFFNLYLLPLTLIFFDFKNKQLKQNIIKWIGLCGVVFILSNVYYSILRLSPFFHIITEKNALFVYPFKQWLMHPFTYFWGNLLIGEKDWLIKYMTVPILLSVVAAYFIDKKFLKEKIILFIWFLIPFLYLALFGNAIYPRFIFFMTLFLLPLAAFTIQRVSLLIPNKKLYIVFCLAVFSFSFYSDYFIIFSFSKAPIPYSDVNQYNNDWPSGTGVKESIQFFKDKAKKGKIYIATQGTFGLMPAAYEMYLSDNKNIELKGYWPIEDFVPKEVLRKSKTMPTYFVFHEPCVPCEGKGLAPVLWEAKSVLQIEKITKSAYFTVYQISPQ